MNADTKNQHGSPSEDGFPKSSDWPLYIRWWRGWQICLIVGIAYQLLVWWGDLMGWLGVKQWLEDKETLQFALLTVTMLLLFVGLPLLIHEVAFASVVRPNLKKRLTPPEAYFKNVDLKPKDRPQ